MNDTQWPRFEVFKQDRPDQPHHNVGSVHAPDAEMALLNARDVFVRRPPAHSLWVAPAKRIWARTAQELAADPTWPPEGDNTAVGPKYLLFQKDSQRASMTFVTYVGAVEAPTPAAALFTGLAGVADPAAFVWWVCPAAAVTASNADDAASMFAPAADKTYREARAYRTVTQMRRVRAAADAEEPAE